MRKDVKAGLLLALGVVVVAGWYYSGKKASEPTIPLAKNGDKKTAVDEKKASTKSTLAGRDSKKPPKRKPSPRTTKKRTAPESANRSKGRSDRVASSKGTDADSKSTNLTSPKTRTSSKPNGTNDAKPGLSDVANELSALAQPKTQASPPSEMSGKTPEGGLLSRMDRDAKTATKTDDEKSNALSANKESAGKNVASKKAAHETNKSELSKSDLDGSERYVVQPGDSFMLLAEVYYGSQSHAGFLMRANPHVKDPKRLRVGTEIRIPELPKSASPRARTSAGLKVDATPSGRTYVVKAGDSLTGIAETQLGATSRWKELYELNKEVIKNPDVLRSGIVLVLPKT